MSVTVTPAQAIAKFTAMRRIIDAPFTEASRSAFVASENAFITALRAAAPHKTGKYAAGIYGVVRINPRTASIQAWGDKPLTQWIIAGTRKHDIWPMLDSQNSPSFGRAVKSYKGGSGAIGRFALYWPGAAHPVRHVLHPGTKANPFHEKVTNEHATKIADAMIGAIVRSMANAL